MRGLQQLKKDTKFTQSQINVQALKNVPEPPSNLAAVSSKYGISMETLMLVRQKQAQQEVRKE